MSFQIVKDDKPAVVSTEDKAQLYAYYAAGDAGRIWAKVKRVDGGNLFVASVLLPRQFKGAGIRYYCFLHVDFFAPPFWHITTPKISLIMDVSNQR